MQIQIMVAGWILLAVSATMVWLYWSNARAARDEAKRWARAYKLDKELAEKAEKEASFFRGRAEEFWGEADKANAEAAKKLAAAMELLSVHESVSCGEPIKVEQAPGHSLRFAARDTPVVYLGDHGVREMPLQSVTRDVVRYVAEFEMTRPATELKNFKEVRKGVAHDLGLRIADALLDDWERQACRG